jgi:hypothetical protein
MKVQAETRSTEPVLPPYTLAERSREWRMRLKAFSWRVRHILRQKLASPRAGSGRCDETEDNAGEKAVGEERRG